MEFHQYFNQLLGLGLEPKALSFVQISLRGVVVFVVALAMVRVADRRFMAKLSAFDVILGFILASMLARAVNGSSAFFPTLGGGFVLVALHRIMAMLAFHWKFFGHLVKGQAVSLAEYGEPNIVNLRRNSISQDDLLEEARLNGQVGDFAEIRCAILERSGHVSVLPVKSK